MSFLPLKKKKKMLIRGHPISVAVHRTGAAMSGAGYGAVREPQRTRFVNATITAAETTGSTMHRDGPATGAWLSWARPGGERKAALKLLVAERPTGAGQGVYYI